ncbi:Complement factor B [Merluccius polli]|uniref:C3/C5 convertase n=1 Tax=Merluccius polli TaxID=89951 RepID=A0AA47NS92_MERPO|nr:Complement factor B [Merluccius polli]
MRTRARPRAATRNTMAAQTTTALQLQPVHLQDEYDDEEPLYCSTEETIRGGNVSYSQGGETGSVLTYHCSQGYDPFPVSHRLCDADGDWSAMFSVNGRLLSRATCKERMCPAQLQLDNGDLWPREQWFLPGTTQSFSCHEGFTMSGSAERTCELSQEWSGTNPICDNYVDACKDPGIPPGALRSGSRFQVGDRVSYRCDTGLDLLGSSQRVCLSSREWSGSAPRCLGGFGRTIDVEDDSRLNIYILLDTSGSVATYFNASRDAAISLIRKLDSFDVQMKFHVTSFASAAVDIVTITDTYTSTFVGLVIERIQKFDPNVHGDGTGTNLHAALHNVNEMMSILKTNGEDNNFKDTQHVIVIITDGVSNTGSNPLVDLARIRSLLGYSNTNEDHTMETLLGMLSHNRLSTQMHITSPYLLPTSSSSDVYVFGIGEGTKKNMLNALASHKQKEQHVFILKDHKTLGEVFNAMINIKTVTKCGVAKEETPSDDPEITGTHTRPWHVTLKIPGSGLTAEGTCYGSVVSRNWILTAAHCFDWSKGHTLSQTITVVHGKEMKAIASLIFLHPNFNVKGLKHRNVSEFYDFDVALVQLNTSIPLDWEARPICLPCTTAASQAMKQVLSTCKQHRNELLPHKENVASFINKQSKRVETLIHIKEQRQACVSKAAWLLKDSANVTLDEFIPERFLCTGGNSRFQNTVSCKGDSGGSLFLRNRMRYIQVGVLSWGSIDLCGTNRKKYQPPAAEARDFHISLFSIMPWLKRHLGQELQFLED